MSHMLHAANRQKGCISTGASPVGLFFPPARAASCFPLARQGGFHVLSKLAPQASTTTL